MLIPSLNKPDTHRRHDDDNAQTKRKNLQTCIHDADLQRTFRVKHLLILSVTVYAKLVARPVPQVNTGTCLAQFGGNADKAVTAWTPAYKFGIRLKSLTAFDSRREKEFFEKN